MDTVSVAEACAACVRMGVPRCIELERKFAKEAVLHMLLCMLSHLEMVSQFFQGAQHQA